jgi:hypothetical protein
MLGGFAVARVQIAYTHKRGSHYNPHERIQAVAGNAGGGWYRSEAQVIEDIDRTGLNSYYVSINGRTVDVVTASHQGRRYVKTTADGYAPNNLLALPEPPARLMP